MWILVGTRALSRVIIQVHSPTHYGGIHNQLLYGWKGNEYLGEPRLVCPDCLCSESRLSSTMPGAPEREPCKWHNIGAEGHVAYQDQAKSNCHVRTHPMLSHNVWHHVDYVLW